MTIPNNFFQAFGTPPRNKKTYEVVHPDPVFLHTLTYENQQTAESVRDALNAAIGPQDRDTDFPTEPWSIREVYLIQDSVSFSPVVMWRVSWSTERSRYEPAGYVENVLLFPEELELPETAEFPPHARNEHWTYVVSSRTYEGAKQSAVELAIQMNRTHGITVADDEQFEEALRRS
jgi:hypothetical protein